MKIKSLKINGFGKIKDKECYVSLLYNYYINNTGYDITLCDFDIHTDHLYSYGTPEELSGHYKRLNKDYNIPVLVGKEFWYHLTGEENFYFELIKAISSVVSESNFKDELNDVIHQLSLTKEIIEISES